MMKQDRRPRLLESADVDKAADDGHCGARADSGECLRAHHHLAAGIDSRCDREVRGARAHQGKVATTAVELDVPEGVTVETLAVPAGWRNRAEAAGSADRGRHLADGHPTRRVRRVRVRRKEPARQDRNRVDAAAALRRRHSERLYQDAVGCHPPDCGDQLAPMKTQ